MSHHFDGKWEARKSETRHILSHWKRLCCLSEVAIKLDGLSGWYYCPPLVFIEVCAALLELIVRSCRLHNSDMWFCKAKRCSNQRDGDLVLLEGKYFLFGVFFLTLGLFPSRVSRNILLNQCNKETRHLCYKCILLIKKNNRLLPCLYGRIQI